MQKLYNKCNMEGQNLSLIRAVIYAIFAKSLKIIWIAVNQAHIFRKIIRILLVYLNVAK